MKYFYDYLIELKKNLSEHSFRYEDSSCVLYLVKYGTVRRLFKELYEKIESEKELLNMDYRELYNLQSALTDLVLCELEIADEKTYSQVEGYVVSSYEINKNLDKLIAMYN